MKTKKNILSLVILISAMLSSCDSDDVKVISIPEGVETTLHVDALNSIYNLPVESENEWSVVKNNSDNWIYFISDKGMGDGNVQLSLSTNLTESMRTATISISDKTGTVDYIINQPPYTGNGENSENDVQYANSGLGMGIYVDENAKHIRDFMSQQIFQFRAMGDNSFKDLGDFVITEDLSSSNCIIKNFASGEKPQTDVDADLTVNIKYGLFSLDMTGNFHMYGSSRDTTSHWASSISRPMTFSTLNYALIAGNYPWEKDMTDEYKKIRSCLFSSEFLNLQEKIETLVSEGKTEKDNALKKELDLLNDEFGPTFIKSVIRGGVADIDYKYSQSSSNDTLSVSGTLTVGFNSLFSIDVKASANYFRTAQTYLNGGTLVMNIEGGDVGAHDSLMKGVAKICSGEKYDLDSIVGQITDWTKTITLTNSVISDITVTGIWSLFSPDSRNIVKSYLKSKYPNGTDKDGNVFCPYLCNVQKLK